MILFFRLIGALLGFAFALRPLTLLSFPFWRCTMSILFDIIIIILLISWALRSIFKTIKAGKEAFKREKIDRPCFDR